MDEPTELTILHGRVIEALDLMGYFHHDEWPMEVEGEEFQLDCYLPDQHVCIEADGPSHGMRGKKDKRRDELLLTIGIPTLRLRWDFIKQLNAEALGRHIYQWVRKWCSNIEERRAKAKAKEPVKRVPREECTCPDDCLRHEDIGGL